MAATRLVTGLAQGGNSVLALRIAIIVTGLVLWQMLAQSGLLYRDVVPSLWAIGSALARLVASAEFYGNLRVTAMEAGLALLVGGVAGLAVGILLGGNRLLSSAFEHYLYWLGPTPKIIFFPVMIMWFGVGPGSKVAMGALSCFFPVALSTAAAMRAINPVLIRVGRTFRAGTLQIVTKIYLPAMRESVINGLRLGLGIAIIGVLLAETKLSNQGLGFLIMQHYQRFDMPALYALMIAIFTIVIAVNALLTGAGAVGGPLRRSRSTKVRST
ncbi:ABC transporter permease [Bradyrhizobium prioriisuperbiae]|uniref:ABC transporter permease n=1 Tax=Bradyrhizobium prioriisuperbiae TaxID=2854389 RepID=UPI0028E2E15F|nr:ABC transporter permease subunit [Bradyrhizobium prioritasuperba]